MDFTWPPSFEVDRSAPDPAADPAAAASSSAGEASPVVQKFPLMPPMALPTSILADPVNPGHVCLRQSLSKAQLTTKGVSLKK